MWPHRQPPTRLPHPWDSPVKNTGAGCHFLLQCMKLKSESEVTQSCPAAHQAPPSMGFSRSLLFSAPFYLWRNWSIKKLSDSLRSYSLSTARMWTSALWLQRLYFQLLHCTHFSPITLQIVMNEIKKNTIYKKIYESEVTQSCPTLCDPMDCSLPGSSVHGIFQAIVLELIAISFSRENV